MVQGTKEELQEIVLQSINKLRKRKARPDLLKLDTHLRKKFRFEQPQVEDTINDMLSSGRIYKVEYKGEISYRNPEKWSNWRSGHVVEGSFNNQRITPVERLNMVMKKLIECDKKKIYKTSGISASVICLGTRSIFPLWNIADDEIYEILRKEASSGSTRIKAVGENFGYGPPSKGVKPRQRNAVSDFASMSSDSDKYCADETKDLFPIEMDELDPLEEEKFQEDIIRYAKNAYATESPPKKKPLRVSIYEKTLRDFVDRRTRFAGKKVATHTLLHFSHTTLRDHAYTPKIYQLTVLQWTPTILCRFLQSKGLHEEGEKLKERCIDGKNFLALSEDQIHRSFGFTTGSALKISGIIEKLQTTVYQHNIPTEIYSENH